MKKFNWLLIIIMVMALFAAPGGIVQADDEPPPEEETTTEPLGHPIIMFLAGLTEMEPEEILAIHEEGYGMGEIAKAYYLLSLVAEEGSEFVLPDGSTMESILALSLETGWGNVYKDLGIHPGSKHGLGWYFHENKNNSDEVEETETLKKGGPPDHANNDKDKVKVKKDK